jgi:hypothetical protein
MSQTSVIFVGLVGSGGDITSEFGIQDGHELHLGQQPVEHKTKRCYLSKKY